MVTNEALLTAHGEQSLRRLAIDIIEHALAAANPYNVVRSRVVLDGDRLLVDGEPIPLPREGRVLFIGAGKASYPIARAIEDLLGDRLDEGIVICKYGQQGALDRIRMVHGSHPIPDRAGAEATRRIIELMSRTGPGDLVIAGITGGSSALMGLPAESISLADYGELTRMLLGCGANIREINAVRKHVAVVGGGKLGASIHPGATLVNLTVSDVIGDPLDYLTDPTVPDTSCLADAREVLGRFDLWEKVPASVAAFFREGGPARENPKQPRSGPCYDVLLLTADAGCEEAARRGRELGLNPLILSTQFEGDSQQLGGAFAAIAREVARSARPLGPPALLIGGGETVVHLGDGPVGHGGPNQEFAAAAAIALDGVPDALVVGLDSDGTDGPCDVAGAMADGFSMARARELGVDLRRALRRHDITEALTRLDDAIMTGATGTNVNDLKFAIVGHPK